VAFIRRSERVSKLKMKRTILNVIVDFLGGSSIQKPLELQDIEIMSKLRNRRGS
jgi:hypothetical protein